MHAHRPENTGTLLEKQLKSVPEKCPWSKEKCPCNRNFKSQLQGHSGTLRDTFKTPILKSVPAYIPHIFLPSPLLGTTRDTLYLPSTYKELKGRRGNKHLYAYIHKGRQKVPLSVPHHDSRVAA